jgi:hypothetical protein
VKLAAADPERHVEHLEFEGAEHSISVACLKRGVATAEHTATAAELDLAERKHPSAGVGRQIADIEARAARFKRLVGD